MPVDDLRFARVVFLYTEIGRGHPSYLDGIVEAISNRYPDLPIYITDVYKGSRSLSLMGWSLIRRSYEVGSRGGIVTSAYTMLRRILGSRTQDSRILEILGRDIIKQLASFPGIVVVAHPLLARILRNRYTVVYQHGEFAVPAEALVFGCHRILVPDYQAAEMCISAGISSDTVLVTGSCIDRHLADKAKAAFEGRLNRLPDSSPFRIAVFSSGAAPQVHIRQILIITEHLLSRGHSLHIYSGQSMRLFAAARRYFDKRTIPYATKTGNSVGLVIIPPSRRIDQDKVFSDCFETYDFFIAPAHERVHYALALGLPQLMLIPHIGTFAPLNAKKVQTAKVGLELPVITSLHGAELAMAPILNGEMMIAMATRGFGVLPANGFNRCADILNSVARSA